MSRALAKCRRREGLQQHIHVRKLSFAEKENDCGPPFREARGARCEV